jgi:hypothetical protein
MAFLLSSCARTESTGFNFWTRRRRTHAFALLRVDEVNQVDFHSFRALAGRGRGWLAGLAIYKASGMKEINDPGSLSRRPGGRSACGILLVAQAAAAAMAKRNFYARLLRYERFILYSFRNYYSLSLLLLLFLCCCSYQYFYLSHHVVGYLYERILQSRLG